MEPNTERIVEDLSPSDGWWKSNTGDVLSAAVTQMKIFGMPEYLAVEVLAGVVDAMREEYGE